MNKLTTLHLLSLLFCICLVSTVKLEKGWFTLDISTGDNNEQYKVDVSGRIRETITLTQSSRIKIKSKLTFSVDGFVPEFFSFRLRHPQYENLSEPVLAEWSQSEGQYNAFIDLGEPKHIKHFSGDYQLEVIISDDKLDSQTRKIIANCKITFRNSLQHPLPGELTYFQPSIIMTEAPAQRVDPPAMFTGFVVLLIIALFSIFLYGLSYQKVNFKLFPSDGTGFILNVVFLGCFGLVLFMLFKFWINWTFIQTIQYFLVTILPISLAANYAFIHIRKS